MDSLPTELLSDIFIHLPQRYSRTICSTVCKKWHQVLNQTFFYSTLHIYNKQQLEKVIQLGKEKRSITNNEETIGHNVKHLLFYYKYISSDEGEVKLLVFPNLQSIDWISSEHQSFIDCTPIYLQLHQPTNFTYYEHSEQWITKFSTIKPYLKSLNIYIWDDLIEYKHQKKYESFDPIHLKNMVRKKMTRTEEQSHPIKILSLSSSSSSSLVNLNRLYISFFIDSDKSFIINEYTIENIHQSCPSLESLSLEGVYFSIYDQDDFILDEYSMHNDKRSCTPAIRLKALDIKYGLFNDPHCFSYFAYKYPNLESFSLSIGARELEFNVHEYNNDDESIFERPLSHMLHQFSCLKKISLSALSYPAYTEEHNRLHPPFIQWLYKHPNQITHLDYNYYLVMDSHGLNNAMSYSTSFYTTICHSDMDKSELQLLLQSQLQPTFLNHLTSLSIIIDSIVQLATIYFSQNTNTYILSNVLKDLKLSDTYDGSVHQLYVYDWLDMFPNLISLEINKMKQIKDNEDKECNPDNEDDFYTNELHQLIKLQKQKQHDILNSNKKKEKKIITYHLKSFKLNNCEVYFKNGLDELLKKCPSLKSLTLSRCSLIQPSYGSDTINHKQWVVDDIYFDLSHLHLEYLCLDHIFYSPDFKLRSLGHLEKLIIKETLNNNECTIIKDRKPYKHFYFNLHINCKYIDGLLVP